MILQLKAVSFRYRPSLQAVLNSFSTGMESGTVTAILGPNGAGKSTLLDLCLGWKQPDNGEVLLHGHRISSYTRRETGRLMSLVPQEEKIRFDYSVLEYALLGRAPYLGQLEIPGERDRQIAEEALEQVGIYHLKGRSINKLSGGEHQLLMVARALTQEPSIMLLDEPTSKLDPANSSRVLAILSTLSTSGVTIIFTTHDPALAARISTHLVLLREGSVLKAGDSGSCLTGDNLTELYGIPMHVHEVAGEKVVIQGGH